MTTIRIGERLVGDGQPCYVIAEAGVNHNGDPALARRLVTVAVNAGADAVKFQKRSVRDILIDAALDVPYNSPTALGATYREHRDRLELSTDAWWDLAEQCRKEGITLLASAWDPRSADFLEELGVPGFKMASASASLCTLVVANNKVPISAISVALRFLAVLGAARACRDAAALQLVATVGLDPLNLREGAVQQRRQLLELRGLAAREVRELPRVLRQVEQQPLAAPGPARDQLVVALDHRAPRGVVAVLAQLEHDGLALLRGVSVHLARQALAGERLGHVQAHQLQYGRG